MKRFLFLIFVSTFWLFFVSDVNAQSKLIKAEPKTIKLDKEGFLKRVVDFENSPTQWKYLGDKPAIIDFYADWCGPCKMLAPVLETVSDKFAGKVDIYKVNVDQEEELASLFNVRSIPTLVFIPMNGELKIAQGAVGQPQLEEAINRLLL